MTGILVVEIDTLGNVTLALPSPRVPIDQIIIRNSSDKSVTIREERV